MDVPKCFYRVSPKALIVFEGKLVLVKEDSNNWDLPGGGVKHREDTINVLKREILEEIGVQADSIDGDSVQPWLMHDEVANRPLCFLVYKAFIASKPPQNHDDVTIGLFSKKDLDSLRLELHLEKFRQNILNAL
jgi:8-oxo-dGTP pyrophosphatase MutT (NUDIX family)